MLSIEEYIAKRKKEDKLNEFNLEKRIDNIKLCIDYVFEYFNAYLDITEVQHQTVTIRSEKIGTAMADNAQRYLRKDESTPSDLFY